MTELERVITIISLVNAAIFYSITIAVFLVTRKTRLNYALAIQKFFWLLLVLLVALPAFVFAAGKPTAPDWLRMLLWVSLSLASWGVLFEVYKANWPYGWRAFLKMLWCETKRLPLRLLRKRPAKC